MDFAGSNLKVNALENLNSFNRSMQVFDLQEAHWIILHSSNTVFEADGK